MYSHHEAKLGWGSSLGDKAYKALKNIVVNCHAPLVRDSMLLQSARS